MTELTDLEKQAARALVQKQIDALLEAAYEIYAAGKAASAPVVVPAPDPVPEVPAPGATARPFQTMVWDAQGKTLTVTTDPLIVKDQVIMQLGNGQSVNVVGVTASKQAGFSDLAIDQTVKTADVVNKLATVKDRYPASAAPVAPPATVEPVPETPTAETPIPAVPATPGAVYLAGVNLGALNNNPYVDNSIATIGTHYRDVEQKYVDKYQKLGCKVVRMMIAPERCVDINKGPLRPSYMAEIKGALDKLAAAGIQAFLDPHSYMRLWSSVPSSYANKYGYGEQNFNGFRKLWIPVGAPDCLMDVAGYADFLNKVTALFASHPAFLGIGVANEPFSSSADPFNVVSKYFADLPIYIAAISAASKTYNIYVGGGEYCTAKNWPAVSDVLKNLADPYGQIVYEAHQYLDGGMYGGGQWQNRNEIIPIDNGVNMVKPFVEWLALNAKRGIIGEQGFPAGNKSAAAATTKLLEYTSAHGVPVFQWCAGAGWSPDDVNAVDDDNMTSKDNLEPIKAFFGKSTTAYGRPGA